MPHPRLIIWFIYIYFLFAVLQTGSLTVPPDPFLSQQRAGVAQLSMYCNRSVENMKSVAGRSSGEGTEMTFIKLLHL